MLPADLAVLSHCIKASKLFDEELKLEHLFHPGFAVDVILRGDIGDYVAVYLGHQAWSKAAGKTLLLDGDRQIAKQLPVWLQFDKVNCSEAA